ncbi:MAG: porin family protein [Saprospiraceae bacterium]|nr:porin family protein [Saprospiraceae bacterium]HNL38359.1 porin family protein [Saprospiraceae bacterium]
MPKKTILFTAALLLGQCSLFSQNIAAGIRAGYTSSTTVDRVSKSVGNFDADDNYRPAGSLHFGADVKIPINNRLSFVGGVLYVQKGYKVDLSNIIIGQSQQFEFQLRYFNVPILADYRVWKGLSIQAGVEPGLLNSAWLKFDGGRSDLKGSDSYKNLDFGLLAGLEWHFQPGFFLSARYIWGVLPVSEFFVVDDNGLSVGQARLYNRALELGAGYRFSF